jgi:hypothetical protein
MECFSDLQRQAAHCQANEKPRVGNCPSDSRIRRRVRHGCLSALSSDASFLATYLRLGFEAPRDSQPVRDYLSQLFLIFGDVLSISQSYQVHRFSGGACGCVWVACGCAHFPLSPDEQWGLIQPVSRSVAKQAYIGLGWQVLVALALAAVWIRRLGGALIPSVTASLLIRTVSLAVLVR